MNFTENTGPVDKHSQALFNALYVYNYLYIRYKKRLITPSIIK